MQKINKIQIIKQDEDLSRVRFRHRRLKFVTNILQEFSDLDPSSLDIIFEAKVAEVKESETDLQNNKFQKREDALKYKI